MDTAPGMTLPDAGYRRGVLYVVMAGLCWSTIGLGVRLMQDANVWQILLYRSFGLLPVLLIFLWFRSGGKLGTAVRTAGWTSVLAAAALVSANIGGIYALQKTSVANAMLIFATAPFIAAFLGRLVLGERVRIVTVLTAVLAIFGVAIMVAGDARDGNISGNLVALGGAFGFAAYALALRSGKSVDMLPSVVLAGLFSIALTAPLAPVLGFSLTLSAHDLPIALALGIFQLGAGLVFFTLGSRTVPAAELTLLTLGEVVLAPVWVWLFLGETVGPDTLIGGAILLGALVINAVSGLRRKPLLISAP